MADLVPLDSFSKLPERYRRRARDIATRVSEIDALCRPASTEEVGDALKRMRRHFRPQPDTDAREMAEGYRDACRDLPAWAVSEAANDYRDGRVDNHTGKFMPTCAEFAKRARSIMTPFLAERHSLRTEAEKLVERATDDHRRHLSEIDRQDPAVKARVAQLVASVSAGLPKPIVYTHRGLSAEAQTKIDALKKPRQFASKIGETKIGRGQ